MLVILVSLLLVGFLPFEPGVFSILFVIIPVLFAIGLAMAIIGYATDKKQNTIE